MTKNLYFRLGLIFGVLWVISEALLNPVVNYYIVKKESNLHAQSYQNLQSFFKENGKELIGIMSYGYNGFSELQPNWKQSKFPPTPNLSKFSKSDVVVRKFYQRQWREYYGDLSSIYEVGLIVPGLDEVNYGMRCGWKLKTINQDGQGFYINSIFPYAVGYKVLSPYLRYDQMPTITQILDEALMFYADRDFSDFRFSTNLYVSQGYKLVNIDDVFDEIRKLCDNEYYMIAEDEFPRFRQAGKYILEGKGNSGEILEKGYMHNNYYRVFIGASQAKTFSLCLKEDVVNNDRRLLMWIGGIGLSIALLIPAIILVYIAFK